MCFSRVIFGGGAFKDENLSIWASLLKDPISGRNLFLESIPEILLFLKIREFCKDFVSENNHMILSYLFQNFDDSWIVIVKLVYLFFT